MTCQMMGDFLDPAEAEMTDLNGNEGWYFSEVRGDLGESTESHASIAGDKELLIWHLTT